LESTSEINDDYHPAHLTYSGSTRFIFAFE